MRPADIDWGRIQFVVFDVDGTLYNQGRLRRRMALEMLAHSVTRGDFGLIPIIKNFRIARERLAEAEVENFEERLVADVSAATGRSIQDVRHVAAEWIEKRPLPYLRTCRFSGLAELFAGIKRQGKAIGIFSDYPAQAKLDALGLHFDHMACADDDEVGVLKPNPKGLTVLMRRAGAAPSSTILIGDRVERDAAAARRAGAHSLIRTQRTLDGVGTFARYDDHIFAPLLAL